MPLDPQIKPVLEASAGMMEIDWSVMDAATLRNALGANKPPCIPLELYSVEDHEVQLASHSIPLRLYRPSDKPNQPVAIYLHGGGWVLGSIDDYDTFCRHLAKRSRCAVLSVGYRLAPEHPYPAAIEDCYAAFTWLAERVGDLGLDESRLAIMGDSAGGNLAAAVAFLDKQRAGPGLRHQLLIYPATDSACDSATFRENDRYFLTPGMMRWYWRQYLGEVTAKDASFAAPARFQDLSGLPEATVITAEFDPLRDEAETYAHALASAGVPTELVRAPGMIHGFAVMLGILDAADGWLDFIASRLARALQDS